MNETGLERDCEDETGDMAVITVAVPRDGRRSLSVTVQGRIVTVTGPNEFRREIPLPPEAQTAPLHALLYDRFLELRAPRGEQTELGERSVPIRVLR